MSEPTATLAQNYACPKCRGRKPSVRDVVLGKAGLLDLLPSKDSRYIEVTCTLCGYTEFYNRAVFLASLSPKKSHEEFPLPEQAHGG